MSIFRSSIWRARRPSDFSPSSTAEEVTAGVDGSHLTAIVTGATSGIGLETARVLALRGVKVIIAARTLESGMKAKQSLTEGAAANPKLEASCDGDGLSSLDSIRRFAASFLSSHKHLNILINNAGVVVFSFQQSQDGIELNFATNHLGHFFLTNLLLDKMKRTAKETYVNGRIINVSSMGHRFCDASNFDRTKLGDGSVKKLAYPHSKLANILHAKELSRRFQVEGCNLTANSLHPGLIQTNISRHSTAVSFLLSLLKYCRKSIPQGAATTCYLALHPNVRDVSGKYFEDCNEAIPSKLSEDEQLAKKLWDLSEELINRWQNHSA